MGLFKGIFGSKDENKKEEKQLPWIPLTTVAQLQEIEEKSKTKTQIIFKHSTTCGISRMVIKMFRDTYNFTEEQADLYYLDLLQYREVSNETGYKFQVIHQSPQLLVIKNGVAVANASHGSISELDFEKYI
ncbi:MAG: bacillithiol system redox-active protein YtxJ [Cellulophaga sp.]|uniref:bacillithiol system redox-active protein YtxJ n=1 Tax=unclassified Cellulophaga TaxID=2634405 RepID=UPI000C2C5D89|nr:MULTISPECIES: bacillithiol system redox-active protein YtxJ [unclassified Cellulophaga]MDO6491499.1 bacillithiol system redox-active protein YtxJ [Cellulophaga sp. 2_MG-2023]MDO6493376.1 bacillithiol system redox-active protein YtxJ [Cellulophaga sp. 3_MG-2023]PKB44635.1 bacillithiol system protein YtxJ [Cellulophaga sp. RHA19]